MIPTKSKVSFTMKYKEQNMVIYKMKKKQDWKLRKNVANAFKDNIFRGKIIRAFLLKRNKIT